MLTKSSWNINPSQYAHQGSSQFSEEIPGSSLSMDFLPTYHNYCLCGFPRKLLNFVPSRYPMGLTLSQQQYIQLFTVLDYFPNVWLWELNQSSFLWCEGHAFESPNIMLVFVDFNCVGHVDLCELNCVFFFFRHILSMIALFCVTERPYAYLFQNGLDTKVEKSRKQMKERKNRAKKIRGVKKVIFVATNYCH